MHILTVVFTVDPADAQKVVDGLRAPLETTRAEAGCISFEVARVEGEPATFVLQERWADKASLDKHMTTEHFKTVGAWIRPLMKTRTQWAGSPIA